MDLRKARGFVQREFISSALMHHLILNPIRSYTDTNLKGPRALQAWDRIGMDSDRTVRR